jgi:hypothetical protein
MNKLLLTSFLMSLIAQIFNNYQQINILNQQILGLISASTKWTNIKYYHRKLGKRKRRNFPSKKCKQSFRNQGNIKKIDIHERTGLFEDDFEDIYFKIKDRIQSPRNKTSFRKITTALSTELRLVMIFHHL